MWWLATLAVAWPSGAPYCTDGGYTIPPGDAETAARDVTVACDSDKRECTITAPKDFKGFAISASSATLTSNAQFVKTNGRCLTHEKQHLRKSITLKVEGTAEKVEIFATVVYEQVGGLHQHLYAVGKGVLFSGTIWVVGAGPGGLGAARRFADLNYDVNLLELGPGEKIPRSQSIAVVNQYSQSKFNRKHKEVALGQGLGGTQNINGAVFAPGKPEEFAASVGVLVKSAQAAMDKAAAMVPHNKDNVTVSNAAYGTGMFWKCLTPDDCDYATVAATNTKMERTNIAYEDLSSRINVVGNCNVTRVSDTAITTEVACAEFPTTIPISDSDIVIVSAGALTSPHLLGADTFTGWNHYYKLGPLLPCSAENPCVDKQTFDYNEDGVEVNRAVLIQLVDGQATRFGIDIEMHMRPQYRETYTKHSPAPGPSGFSNEFREGGYSSAWHFAGTVAHTLFRVNSMTRVYIGDASALKTPFNCHTSMPAAAAGILAAESSLGLLDDQNSLSRETLPETSIIFMVVGVWAFLAGIALHQFDKTKIHHYWLMPTALVLLLAGVIIAHGDDSRLKKNSAHSGIGYAVLSIMVVQAIGGSLMRSMAVRPRWLQIGHRLLGFLGLLLINVQYLMVTIDDDDLNMHTTNLDAYKATAWVYLTLSIAVIANAIQKAWPRDGNPLFDILL